jgi:hypothetical protein
VSSLYYTPYFKDHLVKHPKITFIGGPEMYLDTTSMVNLTCLISWTLSSPRTVAWYHNHTMMETPLQGPWIESLVWLWYQATVRGEERVQDIRQVRFTMLVVSRYISGPPIKVILGCLTR